jgi:S1-C subfamily serine protease
MLTISFPLPEINATVLDIKQNRDLSLPELFGLVNQSVVQISGTTESNVNQGFRLGSGFVYDNRGHVITNFHVVNGENEFLVTFSDGSIYQGQVVGTDAFSDLAVMNVSSVPQEKLKPLTMGNSSKLAVGEQVAAVGNPFGLSGSMTEGIISALGRQLPSIQEPAFGSELALESSFSIPDIIQTDAAINPGNSGGPLLNMKGEVIGINSAIFSNTGVYAGVGFAIPSNTIQKVASALIKNGTYFHPWIGIQGVDITPAISEAMNLNLNESRGFLVTEVNENGPADMAGIQGGNDSTTLDGRSDIKLGGDIIIAIDGKAVTKIDDLLKYLERQSKVGDKVSLEIIRDGTSIDKVATLGKRPTSDTIFQTGNKQLSLGITGVNVTPIIAEAMNLTESKGFLVATVRANGPADKAGIQGGFKIETLNNTQYTLGGDVIVQIDNKTVDTIENIKDHINGKKEGDVVNVKILRNGEIKFFNIKLEMIEMPKDLAPFSELNPFDRNDQQGPLKDFKDQCLERFSEIICDFLPP